MNETNNVEYRGITRKQMADMMQTVMTLSTRNGEVPGYIGVGWTRPETDGAHEYLMIMERRPIYGAKRGETGCYDLHMRVRVPRREVALVYTALKLAVEKLKAGTADFDVWPDMGWDEAYIYDTDVKVGADVMHVKVNCLIERWRKNVAAQGGKQFS